jgi:hypothetical protein
VTTFIYTYKNDKCDGRLVLIIYFCGSGISNFPRFMIFLMDFGTVPNVRV